MQNLDESILVPVWWTSPNGWMYKRNLLHSSHPESTYNYIKNILGKTPEHFGIYASQTTCKHCGRPLQD